MDKVNIDWNKIVSIIEMNINQIIKNEYMNSLFKLPIEIDFLYDKASKYEEQTPNAFASPVDIENQKYQIILGHKLLEALRYHSWELIHNTSILPDLPREEKNKELFLILSDTIFFFWVQFICLHEWAHIVRGHLNYGHQYICKNYAIKEWEKDSDFSFAAIKFYCEIDADRLAGKMIFGYFTLFINQFKQLFNSTTEKAVYDFSLFMIYLFNLLFNLGEKRRSKNHPAPHERMLLFIVALQEGLHIDQTKIDLSEQKFQKITQQALIDHYNFHFDEYNIQIYEFFDINPILNKYYQIMQEQRLDQYKLLIN